MARNALANGAKELQVNETSSKLEYDIELEQWVLDRAKQLSQEGSMFDKIKKATPEIKNLRKCKINQKVPKDLENRRKSHMC